MIDRISEDFFTGIEVESTKFKGLKTLFVVGNQDIELIIKAMNKNPSLQHIYMGANKSVNETNIINIILTCMTLINNGYQVTMDVPAQLFYKLPVYNHYNMSYIISVEVSHAISREGVYLKVDDIAFKRTNPGVWVDSINRYLNPEQFTSWSEYDSDEKIILPRS